MQVFKVFSNLWDFASFKLIFIKVVLA